MYEIFHETFSPSINETSFQIDNITYRLKKPVYNIPSTALRYTFRLPILNRSIALDSFIIHCQGNYDYTDNQNVDHEVNHTIIRRISDKDDRLFVLRTTVFHDLFIDIN